MSEPRLQEGCVSTGVSMFKQIPNQEQLLCEITDCIHNSQELKEILTLIVKKIREFLDIDRVKIYQFATDGSGEVVAEAVQSERLPSLLGLHFPADDIPPYARARFAKARQKVIVDVVAKWKTLDSVDALDTEHNGSNKDLHYAPVDPCHIQYLLAMGVLSSMSVPIFNQGQLWGLLVIHHSEPRHFSEQELQTIQLLNNQLSIAIAQTTLIAQAQRQAQQEAFIHRINRLLAHPIHLSEIWQTVLTETVQALEGDSGRLYIAATITGEAAQLYTMGAQPIQLQPEASAIWQQMMARAPQISIQSSNSEQLSDMHGSPVETLEVLPLAYAIADLAKDPRLEPLAQAFAAASIQSILLIPLRYRNQGVGCLSIFRQEREVQTLWAGRTNLDPRTEIPRQSFAAWCEIKQHTPDWSVDDLKLAQRLGLHLYMAVMQQWIERTMHHHSSHDALTQLPNGILFNQQMALALLTAQQQGDIVAVAVLDLDRFKTFNETFGHAGGDYLLKSVAGRIQASLQNYQATKTSLLARWHGDRFILLLPQIYGAQDITYICQEILNLFATPFYLQNQELYLSACLGVAVAPYDAETAEELLLHAEAAMNQAKQQGKNTYQLYCAKINTKDLEHLTLEVDLHKALARDEFVLYYQPQVELASQKIIGMEALIRWQHPGLGLLTPDQFIPLAEETGLIHGIGEWVLRTACTQHRAWQLAGCPRVAIAVNLSARQFQQHDLVSKITQILQETQMEPGYLELEITESTAMQDVNHTMAILKQLQQMHIQIAIDDFGMGYSSLSWLKHFPIHKIKIDKSFVQDLDSNPSDRAIAQAIVALGQGLDLKLLAEGVETNEQLAFLQSIHCDAVQGYLTGVPLSSQQAVVHLLLNRSEATPSESRQSQSKLVANQGSSPVLVPMMRRERYIDTIDFPANPTSNSSSSNQALAMTQEQLIEKILEYEQLKEELKQQSKREKLVGQIAHKIRQSLNVSDILNTTVTEVRHFLQADRVILYRFQPDWSGEVVVESVAAGCLSIIGEKISDPCFRDNYVKYYRQGRIRAIEDIHQAGLGQCHLELLTKYQVRANLVVPVTYEERLWGLLIAHQCNRPRHWSQIEISLLNQLATQAAIAIHQGELYSQLEMANRELQQLSARDGLTSVANRYRFDQYLSQVWRSLIREKAPLSLIMCDIDYFKAYNDTFGHQGGDRCLQQVAQAIQQAAKRPADLVARYGGEEFAVILPNTSPIGAMLLAEEIGQKVRALGIPHPRSPHQCVTLSLGVAGFVPSRKRSLADLIAKADGALYQAKSDGRDRCVSADVASHI